MMNRVFYCMLIAGLVVVMVSQPALAEDAPQQNKIRVLLTTGGHGFEEEPFYAMFQGISIVSFTKAELPQDAGLLKPGLEKDYDVIVMYDMIEGITAQQQESFVKLLGKGIGIVSLHHNLCAHRHWDEFRRIIGGKFCFEANVIDGKTYGPGGGAIDHVVKVTVANKDHPITKGLENFTIYDEIYWGCYTDPSSRVLLTTNHSEAHPALAWVTKYGDSRVFYLQMGHDRQAWENPHYCEILTRGIRWTAESRVFTGAESADLPVSHRPSP